MMHKTGSLKLELLDVFGEFLAEPVDIYLEHQTLSHRAVARGVAARKAVLIRGLHSTPQGLYRLYIDPPSYLPVSVFVNVASGRVTERTLFFAADPRKVIRVVFPAWADLGAAQALLEASRNVLGFPNQAGEALYASLDDMRRAGLLNIVAKAGRTRLTNGRLVFDGFRELLELRGDRFFTTVSHELREDVTNSIPEGLFHEVSGLAHRPPAGYSLAGSYKTPDRYGNLQLTFFSNGVDWVADVDIDDANGLEHLFQVARNALTGRPTHPYDIQQILVRHQEIDPGYRFILHETPVTRSRAASQKG